MGGRKSAPPAARRFEQPPPLCCNKRTSGLSNRLAIIGDSIIARMASFIPPPPPPPPSPPPPPPAPPNTLAKDAPLAAGAAVGVRQQCLCHVCGGPLKAGVALLQVCCREGARLVALAAGGGAGRAWGRQQVRPAAWVAGGVASLALHRMKAYGAAWTWAAYLSRDCSSNHSERAAPSSAAPLGASPGERGGGRGAGAQMVSLGPAAAPNDTGCCGSSVLRLANSALLARAPTPPRALLGRGSAPIRATHPGRAI